jgi:hypothetical protein
MKNLWILIALFFISFSVKAVCTSGDCLNGYGTYVWESGDMYSGFWKNGEKHYFGMYFWKDGDFWYGLYKNGKRKPSSGIYAWNNGDYENRNNKVTYEEKGCVSGNCNNGWGVYIYDSGSLHAGYWKNGKQHYFGAKFWKSGDFYLGLYKNGKRNSQSHGFYVFKNGKSKTFLDTVKYDKTGCVEGDCENGFGTYIWKNGDLNTGFWKNGKQHFMAFKFWKEKDIFIGIYKDGQRKKRGLYIYETGKMKIRNEKVLFSHLEVIKKQKNNATEKDGNESAPGY